MAHPISNIPLVLFPLRLETRFVNIKKPSGDSEDQLWIRAFPDEAFLQSHNPRLRAEERASAKAFLEAPESEKRSLWEDLVDKFGAYRSAWLVQIGAEELERQEQSARNEGERNEEEAPSFFFKWLPDRLVFYLYKKGRRQPDYTEEGPLIKPEGLTVLGEGDEWVQDFEEAVRVGMGIKIRLQAGDDEFEKIIVSGFRYTEDPAKSARGLADLFYNHQYTEGFSFLPYGTPTNNTEKAASGYSAKDEFDAANSFAYAVNGLNLSEEETDGETGIHTTTVGKYLANSLGFAADHLRHIQNADLRPPKLNEVYQKASWFALGGQPLFMLFGEEISPETHELIWDHYAKYVKARGLYTALKVGNQPYGILPVMSISRAASNPDIQESSRLFDQMTVLLNGMIKRWLKMVEDNPTGIPRLVDAEDSYTEVLRILSMQEYSTSHHIRPLEYSHYQRKLYKWLRQLSPETNLDALLQQRTASNEDYSRTTEKAGSLADLLTGANPAQGLGNLSSALADRFRRSPVLSLAAGKGLIGFQESRALLVDEMGDPISQNNIDEDASFFSFTEEDLSSFTRFIDDLEEKEEEELIQYTGEWSLFTDLFQRSFANALQLYHRDVIFDPSMNELLGSPYFRVGNVLKQKGEQVQTGDAILEIHTSLSASAPAIKKIVIKAPFSGIIREIRPIGEQEIRPGISLFTLFNEEKSRNIKNLFILLGRSIIEASDAIDDSSDRIAAQTSAIREAIDLNSYRLDAWVTSMSARRIEEMRRRPGYEQGVYFGAYGWVENLKKDMEKPVRENNGEYFDDNRSQEGGFIHTPGAGQAVASAIFKNAFLSYREKEETGSEANPFTLNLTSDRLQKGQVLLEGVRQGQELEALLGYQLERYLHEYPEGGRHVEIYALRDAFPLYENSRPDDNIAEFVQLSVVDGLKAIQNKDKLSEVFKGPGSKEKKRVVKECIEKLEDILDGSLDGLFYEAGYQVTQGNLSQAAAALDATKGAAEPPVLDAIKTRLPGTGLSHKLVIAFPEPTVTYSLNNCRALVEPALETWLSERLGPMDKIGAVVDLVNADNEDLIDSLDVTLQDLGIGYLDFLYLSEDPVSDGAGELELRVWNFVIEQLPDLPEETQYIITDIAPDDCQPLAQALEIARYALALLSRCRYLKSEDLSLDGEAVQHDREALRALKTERLDLVVQKLKSIKDADLNQKTALAFLSKLNLEAGKQAFFGDPTANAVQLRAAIEKKMLALEELAATYDEQLPFFEAFELLEKMAKLLFGDAFILLPPAAGSEQFTEVIRANEQQLLVGDPANNTPEQTWGQERIQNWVQGLAQVQENAETFEDWLMVSRIWEQLASLSNSYKYQIVQGPTLLQYPWAALSKKEIDRLLEQQYTDRQIYQNTAGEPYPLSGGDYYPDACECTAIYAPEGFALEEAGQKLPVYGLVIEELTEHIPDEKMDTGLAFHYNAPNNEAPQAILLAVHSKATHESDFFWSEDELRDIIADTIDLYKIRLVDLEAIREYGYLLPMSYWFNIPQVK